MMTLGGTSERWDIHTPIPNDVVFPGQTFIFQLEARLATGAPLPAPPPGTPGVQLYVGVYDNTDLGVAPDTGRRFIEGGAFTITGEVFGTPNPLLNTPAQYRILARTDSGEEALSNIVTLPDAPSTFSGENHPRIHFAGVAGFIQFKVYRFYDGAYVHQYTVGNTIEGTYYDVGNPPIATVAGWPSVTTTKPRAYAATTNFILSPTTWVRYVFTIFVPTTYDRSRTGSGMQYLRFGLTNFTAIPGQILVRRLGLSQGDGTWARSANDTRAGAHSPPSAVAAGSASGSGDGGTGIPPPPPGGGGGGSTGGGGCVLVDSMIEVAGGKR